MRTLITSISAVMLFSACHREPGNGGTARKTKEEKIVALLELTGALNIGKQMSAAMMTQIFSAWEKGGFSTRSEAAELFRKRFSEEVDKELDIKGELTRSFVEVYAKYYSEENIDDMERFYRTETGKKLISTLPSLMAESMAVGQKWGEERGVAIAKEIIGGIKSEGYEIPEI